MCPQQGFPAGFAQDQAPWEGTSHRERCCPQQVCEQRTQWGKLGTRRPPRGSAHHKPLSTTRQMPPVSAGTQGERFLGVSPWRNPHGKSLEEQRELRAAGEAPAAHELPASAEKAGARNTLMQPQKYFPCFLQPAPGCPGEGLGGEGGMLQRGHVAPMGQTPLVARGLAWESGDMGRGSRCSSGEGTQQNPEPGADARLMQIRRVGSSIKIFPG